MLTRSRIAVLAAALLLALMQGCSLVSVGYGKAEMLAAWKAHEYFDLEADQRDLFARRFNRFYLWHRYQQLPDYAAFLTTFRSRLEDGVTREDFLWFAEGLRARYAVMAERGAADAAPVLATLTPQQIAHVQEKWSRDNRTFARDQKVDGTPDAQKRARVKRTLGFIEDWVGRLSREQEDRITAMIDRLPHIEHVRLQDRVRRQRDFIALLDGRKDGPEFTTRLRRWMVEWESARPPEFQRVLDAGLYSRIDMYVEVARLLTPRQRETALKRLQGYIDDFHALSRHSGNQRADNDCQPTGSAPAPASC